MIACNVGFDSAAYWRYQLGSHYLVICFRRRLVVRFPKYFLFFGTPDVVACFNHLRTEDFMPLAHTLGIVGELFNLVGAIFLAVELFNKRSYREEDIVNAQLHQFAIRSDLKATVYRQFLVADPDFTERMAEQRARNIGFAGAVLLICGFVFLVAYHICDALGR
jgi:hypothetical protein